MPNLFRESAIVNKNENADIRSPKLPILDIDILFDKNILNIMEINLSIKVEIVKINPFFKKTLNFLISHQNSRNLFI